MIIRLLIACILLMLPVSYAQAASNDCLASASTPSYEEGKSSPCSVTLDGKIRTYSTFSGSISGADGAIVDGVSAAIKATVKNYTNSKPLTTIIVDTNGDPASIGGGTQYPQGGAATDTDTGTMAMCVLADTAAAATGVINGDRARCIVDATGRIWTHVGTIDGGTITTITNPVTITDGAGALNVIIDSGTTAATQSGTWNITNISGTVSLPTGAATSALQDGIIRDGTGDTTQANVSSGRLQVDGSGVTQPVSGTVTVTDGAGALNVICDSGCGSGTQYAEDAAETAGAQLSMAGSVRRDTAASSAVTTGNNATINTDANGKLWTNADSTAINGVAISVGNGASGTGVQRVTIANDSTGILASIGTSVTPGTSAAHLGKAEDAAHASGDTGVAVLSKRTDAAATSAGADADYATLNTDAAGLLWTRTIDPCSALAKTFLPINISTATTTEITPSLAGASTNYYVCSLVLVSAAANNVALVDDDSDGCVSVTSGMAGGTTAASGFNLAANSGLTFGNGMGSVFKTVGTNRVICLVTSATTQLSGTMTVVAAP